MKSERQVRSLGIEEWYQLTQTGAELPVTIPIDGVSMRPLIRRNIDRVTIRPCRRPLQRGDIVMFFDRRRDRYVLHRVWRLEEGRVLTWGDNCLGPDGWTDMSNIRGVAAAMERNGKRLTLDSDRARRLGIPLARAQHIICRCRFKLRRLLHAMKQLFHKTTGRQSRS